ncbi:hypothetical protein MHB42_15050 [Lysinibacillus sp. FSL K6-0232]
MSLQESRDTTRIKGISIRHLEATREERKQLPLFLHDDVLQ